MLFPTVSELPRMGHGIVSTIGQRRARETPQQRKHDRQINDGFTITTLHKLNLQMRTNRRPWPLPILHDGQLPTAGGGAAATTATLHMHGRKLRPDGSRYFPPLQMPSGSSHASTAGSASR